jgi:Zn-dependent protease
MHNVAFAAGVAAAFFLGIVGHGYVSARVSDAMGDKTPRLYGRLTFSPKAHYEPVGSIILPAIFVIAALVGSTFPVMFGWGKRHASTPRTATGKAAILPALAGPLYTLALAIAGGAVARVLGCGGSPTLYLFVLAFTYVCTFLTVVELLPIPGRDGATVIATYLSPRARLKYEELAEYEILFMIGLLVVLAGVLRGIATPIFNAVIGPAC